MQTRCVDRTAAQPFRRRIRGVAGDLAPCRRAGTTHPGGQSADTLLIWRSIRRGQRVRRDTEYVCPDPLAYGAGATLMNAGLTATTLRSNDMRVTPWWKALKLRTEIISGGGQIDDVQMS